MTLTHLDALGEANMVDVGDKNVTYRIARACSTILMSDTAFEQLLLGNNKKGDVFAVARIAGIQAAKRTADLIPLCHTLMLSKVDIKLAAVSSRKAVEIVCEVRTSGQTGVEMEALTGASVAALTVYDMCKAVDKGMRIVEVSLLEKSGGASGHWQRSGAAEKADGTSTLENGDKS